MANANATGTDPNHGKAVIVSAKAGKNPGECIGTYDGYHIVFLPNGTEDGKTYRVKLAAIRPDARGRMMYRGTPDLVVQSDRWRDNGDGTISHLFITTDWKLAETESVMVTRPKTQRDGEPYEVHTQRFEWGTDLANARYVFAIESRRAIHEESVTGDGGLGETNVATRVVGSEEEAFSVRNVELLSTGYSLFFWRLSKEYPERQKVDVEIVCGADGAKKQCSFENFSEVPAWLQAHLQAPYPVCACSRARVDTLAGQTTCTQCMADESKLASVNAYLPLVRRKTFAEAAAGFVQVSEANRAWEGEVGAKLVAFLSAHQDEDGEAPTEWRGYPWYYFHADGTVFASRFSPTAMDFLTRLGVASGGGLLMFAAWLTTARGHRTEAAENDYFARTQEKGEAVEPQPNPDTLQHACIAVKLCGSRAEREAAEAARSVLQALSLRNSDADDVFAQRDYAAATPLYARAAEMHAWSALQARRSAMPASASVPVHTEASASLPTSAPGTSVTFTFKSERHFTCGACKGVAMMDRPQWNRFRNTGRGDIVCACGASGEVLQAQVPAATQAQTPPPRTESKKKAGTPLDVSGLFGKRSGR